MHASYDLLRTHVARIGARTLPNGLFAVFVFASVVGCASTTQPVDTRVKAVETLEPSRYTGTWYEIARLPNRFQDQCQGNVTATYALDDSSGMAVTNECLNKNGKNDKAVGRARRAGDAPSQLKVSFLPSLLSKITWLPFGWGDYWVLDVPADYSHSMVGTPDNKYLWMLSRTPEMSEATYNQLLSKANQMGFNTAALVKTPQGL